MYHASERHLGIFQYGRKPGGSGHAAKHVEELLALVAELRQRVKQLEGELSDCQNNCRNAQQAQSAAEKNAQALQNRMHAAESSLQRALNSPPAVKTETVTVVDEMTESERRKAEADRRRAEMEREQLAALQDKNKNAAVKMMQNIMQSWLGTSLRGLTFTWQTNWRNEKEAADEFARLCALKGINQAAAMKKLADIMTAWFGNSVRGMVFRWLTNLKDDKALQAAMELAAARAAARGISQAAAIKMLSNIMMSWLGTSMRGCYFTWSQRFKDDKSAAEADGLREAARLEALRLRMENASEEERRQLLVMQQAAGRWKNRQQAACWLTWREKYLQVLHYLAVLKKSHARWTKTKLSAALQKWMSVTDFSSARPLKVKLVVQDMKPLKPKGQYLARGNRYGIAIAEASYSEHYEYASRSESRREAQELRDNLSPSPSHQHAMTPRGHALIKSQTPRGSKSPRASPSMSPRVGNMARSGEVLLVKSTETTLCVSWLAAGKVPHTLNLGGSDGQFKPIAILDPAKDKHNSQLCYTITHLQPFKKYAIRVDVGSSTNAFSGTFETLQADRARKVPQVPLTNTIAAQGQFSRVGKATVVENRPKRASQRTPRTPRTGSTGPASGSKTPRTPRTVAGPTRALF